jgi:hypothetical protein
MPTPPSIPINRKAEVIQLAEYGYTDAQIADRLGCSRITVFNFRRVHGIKKKLGGYRPRKPLIVIQNTAELPIRTYFDKAVKHLVKVYAPRMASGDIPVEDWP